MKDDVRMIAIDQIRIVNPRHRDKKKFELVLQSIKNLGLKKPIQVSLRAAHEGSEPGYDLVCGQGRIEAFVALGHKEIPAIVVEISKEDRLLRSLVENIARRFSAPLDLINEIERLKAAGYNNSAIAKKLDICDTTVGGLIALKNAGEERLLDSAISGKIPLSTAMEIARAKSPEDQRALFKAVESKLLNKVSIRVVKRLIDQRRAFGKQRGMKGRSLKRSKTSAEGLVNAYRKESQRQRMLVRKAEICEAKMVFLVAAFNKLLTDQNFITLLKAENLFSMPTCLWDKLSLAQKEAA